MQWDVDLLMSTALDKSLLLLEEKMWWSGIITEAVCSLFAQHIIANGKINLGSDIIKCKLVLLRGISCGRNYGN